MAQRQNVGKQVPKVNHGNRPEFVEYYLAAANSRAAVERSKAIRATVKAVLTQFGWRNDTSLKVADIGCGPGAQSAVWLEEGHHVYGLDVSEAFVEEARERLGGTPRAEFLVGSAASLPWPDALMDVCLMPELLEHVPQWQRSLAEAVRVLKPGGVLYLSTTNTLCPRQDEFRLPFYSWYPGVLKRKFAMLAQTTWPGIAGYATYPAVNWFSYPGLLGYLKAMGLTPYDRFQLAAIRGITGWKGSSVNWIAEHPLARRLAYFACSSSVVLAVKRPAHQLHAG